MVPAEFIEGREDFMEPAVLKDALERATVSLARNAIDRSYDHEGARGSLQLGRFGLAFLSLSWRMPVARYLAPAGAAFLALRQP